MTNLHIIIDEEDDEKNVIKIKSPIIPRVGEALWLDFCDRKNIFDNGLRVKDVQYCFGRDSKELEYATIFVKSD